MNIFQELIAAQQEGRPAVLATVVEVAGSAPGRLGDRMLVMADGSIKGTIGGGAIENTIIAEARQLMGAAEPKLLHYSLADLGMSCGGAMRVMLEPITRPPDLLIFGAGHIGTALCAIGKMLAFTVTVVDNRPEFADNTRLPGADNVIARDYPTALSEILFSDRSFIVILTHRHEHDFEILQYCARQPFQYLGMIGSRTKVEKALQQLRGSGIDEETIRRIHAPIGITIGGNTPAEIAVAIAAQLIAVRSGADKGRLP